MGHTPSSVFASLRRRPLAERRILALSSYLALTAVILAGWITSLGQAIPSLTPPSPPSQAPGTETKPVAGAAAGETQTLSAQPTAPLQALKEALQGTLAESKGIIEKLNRPERAPAAAPEPPPAAPGAGALLPPAVGQPAAARLAGRAAPTKQNTMHTIKEDGPARLLTGSPLRPPYSAYAASRLLSTPLDAAVRPPAAGDRTSRIGEVIAYNLGEIARTAVDFYRYFSQ